MSDDTQVGNADYLKKEIEGMQVRKQALLTSLQNDVSLLEQEKDGIALQIGNSVYTAYKNIEEDSNIDLTSNEETTALFGQMEELDKNIEEKKSKMAEITARYDEEIEILTKSLGTSIPEPAPVPLAPVPQPEPVPEPPEPQDEPVKPEPAPAQPEPQPAAEAPAVATFCGECGTRYTPGVNLFCEECGNKLG